MTNAVEIKKSDIITIKQEKQNNKEKTYSCDICERSVESNSKLIIHKRVQSEVKPFFCDICGKLFSQKAS